jgi:hypothetical protein
LKGFCLHCWILPFASIITNILKAGVHSSIKLNNRDVYFTSA